MSLSPNELAIAAVVVIIAIAVAISGLRRKK